MNAASRGFGAVFEVGSLGNLTDGQLLARFVEAGEGVAFELIVGRHASMVMGVCRRILGDHHDAEDAFQATFLVLARRAASISSPEKLGNWLYGVSCQTATKARGTRARRRTREGPVADVPEPRWKPPQEDDRLDGLDREIRRLPEKYRVVVVLCDLEGKTLAEAAGQLGWPVGTVSGRLSKARATLARRLARRGGVPSGGLLAGLTIRAGAARPSIASTAWGATRFAAGQAASGVVSAKAALLAEGTLKGMMMTKFKIVGASVILAALVSVGVMKTGPGGKVEASDPPGKEEDVGPRARPVESPGPPDSIGQDTIAADAEIGKLEGTWAIIDHVSGGKRADAEDRRKGLGRVVIKGNKMTILVRKDPKPVRASFDVNPSLSPKIIGFTALNDRMEEEDDMPIWLGIYKLEKDTLTIHMGLDRPEGFEVGPDAKMQDLLVLKWVRR